MSCCCCTFDDGGPDDCFGNGSSVGTCCLISGNGMCSWWDSFVATAKSVFTDTTGIGTLNNPNDSAASGNCLISNVKSLFGDLEWILILAVILLALYLIAPLIIPLEKRG